MCRLDFGKPFPAASADPTGTSLLDSLQGQGVTGTVSFKPPAGDAAYGDGSLVLKNTGAKDLQVYLPLGSVFPPGKATDQRLLGYALGTRQAGAGGSGTAASTPAPGVTAAPTNTEVATATVMATDTVSYLCRL